MAVMQGRDFEVSVTGTGVEDMWPNPCETVYGGHDLGEPRRWARMLGVWWLERECSRCKVMFHAGTEL